MKAYVYQAALYCEDCGQRIAEGLPYDEDSNNFPSGPWPEGGGEADCPQHCGTCGVFLDNPLTPDGETYVRDAFREFVETGRGSPDVLREWRDAYGWAWDDFTDITLPIIEEEGGGLKAAQWERLRSLDGSY